MTTYIPYENERYYMNKWRIQCFNCDSILETFDCNCKCGSIIVKNGRQTWPYIPTRDVSIWITPSGTTLPQSVVDRYFLSREANHSRTNTKAGTSASGSTNAGGIDIKDGKGGKSS